MHGLMLLLLFLTAVGSFTPRGLPRFACRGLQAVGKAPGKLVRRQPVKQQQQQQEQSVKQQPQPVAPEEKDEEFPDDGFRSKMREFRKSNAPKKLVKAVQELSAEGLLDQNMTVYAFRTLQRMNRSDLCPELVPSWLQAVSQTPLQRVELAAATAMLRSFCRVGRMDLAESIARAAGCSADSSGAGLVLPEATALMLPELAYGHLLAGPESHDRSLLYLRRLAAHANTTIDLDLSKAILRGYLREGRSVADVREVVRLLLRLQGLGDNDSLQLLTSSFMRSIDFVKGAVSMETLPPAYCKEAAFIGRSNVGKSSLINMLSNRKGLAFTSKTPGKTSEFNYFDSNGTIGAAGERHRFYLVDLPGVGYAEVSRDLRRSWLLLLNEYVTQRSTLRVLFHLIDSRHGMLEADEECLSLLQTLPPHVQYCVVLTKADKRGGGLKHDYVDRINREIKKRTDRYVPILLSSSETREGGVDIWSVLLDSIAKT